MNIPLYSQTGEKTAELSLNPKIFEVKVNRGLIHRAVVRQQSNSRSPIAHTLTKGYVRGGGRKPWRQKGTGRARQGSIRAPHWRGGGVTFGPTNERNFKKEMSKKERRLALFSILTTKAKELNIIALEDYKTETPKTKLFNQLLQKLPIDRNVLIVLPKKNEVIERCSRNLSYAKPILVNYLNPHDLLTYRKVLFMKEALTKLEEIFLGVKDKR